MPRTAALDKLQAMKEPTTGTRVVLVGGGPRGALQAEAEINLLHERGGDFKRAQELGARYDIQTVIVERKSEDHVARGNAWGPDQGGGTVNTGIEQAGMDLTQRMQSHLIAHREEFQAKYDRENPIAATTLRTAFEGGDAIGGGVPATARGVLTRADQGAEALAHFNLERERAAAALPSYHLDVLTETSANRIDITTDPAKPRVELTDARSGEKVGTLVADLVRLNTGTTVASPLSDPAVLRHSYVGPMDGRKVATFLAERGLLDEQGLLKPGTRLALGGSSLSSYDEFLALLPSAHILEVAVKDPARPKTDADNIAPAYRITDEARAKYQGAITFISATAGKWAPGRHTAKSPEWTQKTDALGNTNELHAAFMHNHGEAVYTHWDQLMQGSIALAHGTTPDQVDEPGLSTHELWARQHERNEFHTAKLAEAIPLQGLDKLAKIREAGQTLEGAYRQAATQTIIGAGMERNIGQAIQELKEKAPLSAGAAGSYLTLNAQVSGITKIQEAGRLPENREMLARFNTWFAHVTASPHTVQDLIFKLHEAGIASHMNGSYGAFAENDEEGGRALKFTAKDGSTAQFDAFIVAPTFNRGAEPAVQSLRGQVTLVHPAIPDLPEVGANRHILGLDGQPSNVQDFSLIGKGATVPGTRSQVGEGSYDVNNKESGTQRAPGLALYRMAVEHLTAAGVENPTEKVRAMYAEHLPDPADFHSEVRQFAPHFSDLQHKSMFIQAATQSAGGDPEVFAALVAKSGIGSPNATLNPVPGATAPTRSAEIKAKGVLLEPLLKPRFDSPDGQPHIDQAMRDSLAGHRKGAAKFADATANEKEAFQPMSRDQHFARFVDYPQDIHEAVYKQALAMAERKLTGRESGSPLPPTDIGTQGG